MSKERPTLLALGRRRPRIAPSAFIAPGVRISGAVSLGAHVSVWYNAVLRADVAPIRVGARTNIQDGSVVHVDEDEPCIIGADVHIGHQAMLHSCVIRPGTLIGIGAVILSGARIGAGSLIGAAALVTEGMRVPPRSVVLGVPGRIVRDVTSRELTYQRYWIRRYQRLAREHRRALGQAVRSSRP